MDKFLKANWIKIFGLIIFGLIFSLSNSVEVKASNVINKISQQVSIDNQSVATITETIDYNFITESHGINRYYELVSKNSSDRYYSTNYQLLGVTQDGVSAITDSGKINNQFRIKIGDPNKFLSGVHRYQIRYKIWPVVRQDPSGDYINYDVTGNNWQVPIKSASAIITLPANISPSKLRCYTGPAGSTQQDCNISSDSNVVSLSSNGITEVNSGLTANILTPSGSFANYLQPNDPPAAATNSTTILIVILNLVLCAIIVLIGVVIRFIRHLKKRKAQKSETIVAQYDLPKGMLPAEAGILVDNKTNMREITATIIDLAVRGHMKIKKIKNDYEFTLKNTNGDDLANYEKTILSIFTNSPDNKNSIILLSNIDKSLASTSIKTAQETIVKNLQSNGYYQKGKVSTITSSFSIFGSIVFMIAMGFIFKNFAFFILPFFSIFIAYQITRTSELTSKGYDNWALVKGLELYLTVAEKDRINFHEAPNKTPAHFSKLLPSAIALGVEKEWAKQFESIDISKSIDWYYSPDPLTTLVFVDVLSNDFSSSLNSSFVAPSSPSFGSSSGNFDSGGFSGGGDSGGGGGGDW